MRFTPLKLVLYYTCVTDQTAADKQSFGFTQARSPSYFEIAKFIIIG
jgi:hypothetical protein